MKIAPFGKAPMSTFACLEILYHAKAGFWQRAADSGQREKIGAEHAGALREGRRPRMRGLLSCFIACIQPVFGCIRDP